MAYLEDVCWLVLAGDLPGAELMLNFPDYEADKGAVQRSAGWQITIIITWTLSPAFILCTLQTKVVTFAFLDKFKNIY